MMVIYRRNWQNAAEKRHNFSGETNFLHDAGIYSLCARGSRGKEIRNSRLSYADSMV